MNASAPGERIAHRFEAIVVTILQVFVMVVIAIAVLLIWYLLATGLRDRLAEIQSLPQLQEALQNALAGVLLVVIGLELLETLRTYFATRRIRLDVILVVALIAVGRHVILLDFERATGTSLAGIAALVLSLAAGYWLIGGRARDDERRPT